ncbi:hypothetical protein, partial [Paenibacillus validus]|uniref:hypothetical protein n=1 Tax=Paenibacillus validus TaxID=44253 RepID=UPI002E22366B|nr:hypothetical protein [Paenibacillus validus]
VRILELVRAYLNVIYVVTTSGHMTATPFKELRDFTLYRIELSIASLPAAYGLRAWMAVSGS